MDENRLSEIREFAFLQTVNIPIPKRFKFAKEIENYISWGVIPDDNEDASESQKPGNLTEAVKEALTEDTPAEESPKLILDLTGMTQEEVQLIVNVIEKQIEKNVEARNSGNIFQELGYEQKTTEEVGPERLSEEKSDS